MNIPPPLDLENTIEILTARCTLWLRYRHKYRLDDISYIKKVTWKQGFGDTLLYAFDGNRYKAQAFGREITIRQLHYGGLPPNGYDAVDVPQKNDLVVYFEGNKVTHLGKSLGGGTVESEWDDYGIFQHPLEMVPQGFGDRVRFFAPNPHFFRILPRESALFHAEMLLLEELRPGSVPSVLYLGALGFFDNN